MGKLSPGLMESARWLQLAEIEEADSRPPWSGEMEKSAWGCGGTALGLLRILITCRRDRQCQRLDPRAPLRKDRTERPRADLSRQQPCVGNGCWSSVFALPDMGPRDCSLSEAPGARQALCHFLSFMAWFEGVTLCLLQNE